MIITEPLSDDVIDVHAHLGPYSRFFIPNPDAATMVHVMDRTGTQVAVISSNLAIQQDAHAGNTLTLTAADHYPDRIAAYAVINPWQHPEAELQRLADDHRFVGIKIHPSLHGYPVTGARYRSMWEFADAAGCPVLTHTDNDSDVDRPALLGEIAEQYPQVPLLLGHSGISPAGVDAAVAVAAAHDQVRLEICGSRMTGALIGDVIDRLGAERVLFGSDFPFIDQRMSLGRVVYSALNQSARRSVLGANARRFFGWRPLPLPSRPAEPPTEPAGEHR